MNLTGFDYYSDSPDPSIGLTRTASLIKQARAQAEERGDLVLLFDNGDALQGAPIGEWAVGQTEERHILMKAFDILEYDAVGLGNHDFGFGLDVLDRVMRQAPCPVLCSNATRQDAAPIWQSHAILNRSISANGQKTTLKIGVFSVLPPQTAKWEANHLKGVVDIDDIVTCARTKTKELKSAGCDLIIALAHTGLGTSAPEPLIENAIIPLAAVDGIDAIIAGHSHLTLPGAAHDGLEHVDWQNGFVHGKPVMMPGAAGSHLGVIDLSLSAKQDGEWKVTSQRTELRPISATASLNPPVEDPEMRRLFAEGHAATRKISDQPVGKTRQHLHSYFSFCVADRGLALVASAQAAALRPYLKDTPHESLPVLSAVSPSKFGGRAGPRFFTDVPPGQIRLRHVHDLSVFPNELMAVIVTAEQVKDWLEMSASVLNQMQPGHQRDLLSPGRAGHNFDVLHGLTYQIDLSHPARFDMGGDMTNPLNSRIRDLRFDGHPICKSQSFVVALNNYRANGGGHFPFVDSAPQIPLPVLPIQRALRDYLSGVTDPDPLDNAKPPFSLLPVPGAFAILRTGAKALQHLAELDEFDPKAIGQDDSGFTQIRLTL